MTEIPFEVAIQRGLGRVVLQLRERGDGTEHREAIQHACRNNLKHDWWTECHRGEYLADVLEASGDFDWHAPRLKEALFLPEVYFKQLAMICAWLTRRGLADLRSELYAAWSTRFHRLTEKSRMDGDGALLWMDGAEGWRYVQRELLASPLSEEDFWLEESIYDELVEQLGSKAARRAGDSDPALRSAIERIHKKKHSRRGKYQPPPPVPTIEAEIWEALENSEAHWGPYRLARHAPRKVFRALAARVPTEPELLKRWLKLFRERPYPLSPKPLLLLTEHSDAQIAWYALHALSPVRHPRVRAFAEHLANSDSYHRARIADFLATNPGPNDTALLEQVWESLTNDEERHHFVLSMREFHDMRPDDAPTRLLITLYENSPCSVCRGSLVEWIMERKAAPDWLLTEIAWDCDTDTRAFQTE